ncbi:hypothetical protein L208DRAFT_1417791 [Tricholoma matsutake]|nr:hypothetical protein L208DRAFT_1417791 [Tricholoma matsutake 945]
MSETCYPLRNCLAHEYVAASTPGEILSSSASTTNLESAGVASLPLTLMSGPAVEEAATARNEQNFPVDQVVSPRLYSDVVATRPSSAASRHDDTQLDVGISDICSAPITPYLESFLSQVDHAFNDDLTLYSSTRIMTEDSPDEETNKNEPWTLVESK